MSFQKMRLYSYGLNEGFRNVFGLGQRFHLHRVKNGTDWYYIDQDETRKMMLHLQMKLNSKAFTSSGLEKLANNLKNNFKKVLAEVKRFNLDWSRMNDKLLLKSLKEYIKLDNSAGAYYWILFDDFERLLTDQLRESMAAGSFNKKEIKKIITVLSQPMLVTPLDMEHLSLLRIALLGGKKQQRSLVRHWKKFLFLPMYDIDYDPYTHKHFEKELKRIKKKYSEPEIKAEIKKIINKYLMREKQSEKIFKKLKANPKIFGMARFFSTFAAYKDRKPFVRDRVGYGVRNLFVEVAKRLSLSLSETLFLTEPELTDGLLQNKVFSGLEIKKRIDDSAFVVKDGKVSIFTKKSDLKKIDKILELAKSSKILSGVPASSGKAKGVAAIIFSNSEFSKFKNGNVLITSATRPDYVPLMKKANAIVTDEGGFLSHAAIVSRELGIPCVVGIKIATEVLKDGDLVEVNAEHGIVKIIKRAK